MILYHGSNTEIENINLEKCLPYKDFGKGFYLTDIEDQAMRMAERVAKIRGGIPVINTYSFDEVNLTNGTLDIKIFDRPSEEWASFVMANRDKKAMHPIHTHDIVIGPVANDTMATQFRIFEDGFIDIKELTKRLEYKEFTKQLFFASDKALRLLNKL